MSNKKVTISLFVIALLIFTIYFSVLNLLFPAGEPIKSELENIRKYAHEENWEQVRQTLKELERDWGIAKGILSLNYGERDFSVFLEYMGRLKASVDIEDKSQVTSDAAAILALWDNFIKVFPEP